VISRASLWLKLRIWAWLNFSEVIILNANIID
jgi:hypothetical protein